MKRTVLFASLVIALAPGCGKKSSQTSSTPPPDTTAEAQAANPEAAKAPEAPGTAPVPVPEAASGTESKTNAPEATADLTGLTIQLRQWMMGTRSGLPKSFEDWVAKAHIQVAPPPPGKKYAITRNAWVVLVDK